MPLVNISIPKGKPREYVKAIADGVNSAVIETMDFPDDDRYQIIHEVEDYCLDYQGRTGDRVMMFLKCTENLKANPGIDPANVLITIAENHDIDWSFKDGIASFVV